MCLAVPGKVVKRDDDLKATVDMMGIERPVSLRPALCRPATHRALL